MNQRQQAKQNTLTPTPPSIERPGPEGEADEEEPSEVRCFLKFTCFNAEL